MQTMGLDLGFRNVKASSSLDFLFDSVIGYPSAIELKHDNDDRHTLDNLAIEDEGKTYYVGKKALRDTKNAQLTFTADKTDNKTDKIKTMAAVGYAMGEKNVESFRVVTGLPVDELGIDGLKEKMEGNMQTCYAFMFNGKLKEAQIEKVNVIAQSAGAYYDYILGDNGQVLDEYIKPKTVVIDIGFRTTDVVCMENAKYNAPESFTIYTGVHHIHSELRKVLLRRHRIQKQMSELDKITRQGYITINDQQVEIRKSIREATQPYVEKIISELPLYIPNLSEVNNFLITGGGANLMYEFFEQALDSPSDLVPESEMANARGYHKYLKLLMENGM